MSKCANDNVFSDYINFTGIPEFHNPVLQGKKGLVAAHAYADARKKLRTLLPDEYAASGYKLAFKAFDPAPLRIAVSAVS